MNLSDSEILELNELCGALVDGSITPAQRERLATLLKTSSEARRYYVREMALSASLGSYAAEMQLEAPDATTIFRPAVWWTAGLLAAAASIALALWLKTAPAPSELQAGLKSQDFVARLTGAKNCRWAGKSLDLRTGDPLRRGQALELGAGFAEITFDSGAQVVLEGPAQFDVNSAWDATLRRGALKAIVPPEAIGFRISNSAVDVVDLGTEFSMYADANGTADVLVIKGSVEAAPGEPEEESTIVLHEKEARRFAPSGITDVSDSEQKFARLIHPGPLDHSSPSGTCVHWSFDEGTGGVLHADTFGTGAAAFDARLDSISETAASGAHAKGRWQGSLKFDGKLLASAAYPGLSGNTAHTVAFWVRVPVDAALSDAYAMVAWPTTIKKLNSRPVHVSWNRNPTEGTVGVLRTDFGGGSSMGTTSLRDGQWHHVAVIFIPGREDDSTVQVKQYVDARLDGITTIPGKKRSPSAQLAGWEYGSPIDTLWLGRRLGNTRQQKDRFRGELDELFVADRILTPHDIAQLMRDNQAPRSETAAATPPGNDPAHAP